MRKHKGINQTTGRLKKGYKYSGRKLKSGLSQIIKIQNKKIKRGGNNSFLKKKIGRFTVSKDYDNKKISFDENVKVKKQPFNDCPKQYRVSGMTDIDNENHITKKWKCRPGFTEFITQNGHRCCAPRKIGYQLNKPTRYGNFDSKLKNPNKLKTYGKSNERVIRKKIKGNPNIKSAWINES